MSGKRRRDIRDIMARSGLGRADAIAENDRRQAAKHPPAVTVQAGAATATSSVPLPGPAEDED